MRGHDTRRSLGMATISGHRFMQRGAEVREFLFDVFPGRHRLIAELGTSRSAHQAELHERHLRDRLRGSHRRTCLDEAAAATEEVVSESDDTTVR